MYRMIRTETNSNMESKWCLQFMFFSKKSHSFVRYQRKMSVFNKVFVLRMNAYKSYYNSRMFTCLMLTISAHWMENLACDLTPPPPPPPTHTHTHTHTPWPFNLMNPGLLDLAWARHWGTCWNTVVTFFFLKLFESTLHNDYSCESVLFLQM